MKVFFWFHGMSVDKEIWLKKMQTCVPLHLRSFGLWSSKVFEIYPLAFRDAVLEYTLGLIGAND